MGLRRVLEGAAWPAPATATETPHVDRQRAATHGAEKATRPEPGTSTMKPPRYPDLRRNSIPDTTSITIGGSA